MVYITICGYSEIIDQYLRKPALAIASIMQKQFYLEMVNKNVKNKGVLLKKLFKLFVSDGFAYKVDDIFILFCLINVRLNYGRGYHI